MSFPDTSSAGDIVALVFIALFGLAFVMMVVGCIIMQCNFNCMQNIFWTPSPAQRRLVQHVGRRKLRVGAHRGGSINAAENSIGAFQAAVRSGAGLLELDLNISKDGVPIVSHDLELARVIDPAWLAAHPECKTVSDCDSKNLPPLASKIALHFPSPTRTHYNSEHTASDFENTTPDADAPPPSTGINNRFCTLQEFLEFAPADVALHIDIKQPSELLVSKTLEVFSSHRRASVPNIVVGAGSPSNSKILAQSLARSRGCDCCNDQSCWGCGGCCVSCCCCSCCPCSALEGDDAVAGNEPLLGENRPLLFANLLQVILTHLFYFLGLLPWMALPYDVFSVPAPTTALVESFGARAGEGCCASYLLCFFKCFMTTPKLWAYLRSRGIVVFGWVLNDTKSFAEAAEWEMDGIMTDDVPLLVSFYSSPAHNATFMKDPPGVMV